MRKGQRKALYKKSEGLLSKALLGNRCTAYGLETREKLGLRQRYVFKNEKSGVESNSKKTGIKVEAVG